MFLQNFDLSSSRVVMYIFSAWMTLGSPVWSDDSCNALLQHGIYDRLVETGAASIRSKAEDGVCRAYHQYQSDTQHGDGSGNYYEVISGNASYTAKEAQTTQRLADYGWGLAPQKGGSVAHLEIVSTMTTGARPHKKIESDLGEQQ